MIGASSGIGREMALLLVRNNYKVGITGRRGGLLTELKKKYSDKILEQSFDITGADNAKELERLVRKLGGLDLLIFCAGCEARNPDLCIDIEYRSISTNIIGFTEIVNWVLRYFIQQQSGQLIAISSIAGLRGGRRAPSYNASKAFQINYLEGLRQLVKKKNLPICISDIRPGFVDTNLANKEVMFWEIDPRKASELIYQAVRRKWEIAYIPLRWRIFVVLLRILPNCVYSRL